MTKKPKNLAIKYDGSDTEMIHLGLIDEMGCENNKTRNELNQYLARVAQRMHPNAKPHTR